MSYNAFAKSNGKHFTCAGATCGKFRKS